MSLTPNIQLIKFALLKYYIMETTILIARILSICYLAFALGILINRNYYQRELPKLVDNATIGLYGGFMAIVFGLLILHNNNTWDNDWTTIITIIGWIAVLKGVFLLVFPTHLSIYKNNILNPKYLIKIIFPIALLFGLLLGYFGFVK